MSKKIGILGARGNVGNAFINAFTNYSNEFGAEDIYPITRDYFDSDIRSRSRDFLLKELDILILAVKPKDAVSVLNLIRGTISKKTLIISTVSGLNMSIIRNIIGTDHDRIVKLTLNTNIEHSNGVIVYSATSQNTNEEVQKIFAPFSKVIINRPAKKIIPAVTLVGSGNAFFAKLVMLRHAQYPEIPFNQFVKGLSMDDIWIERYIDAVEAASRILFNDDSLIRISSESTLHSLRKSCLTYLDVELHIKKVATEGGCTRIGIDDFDSLEKVRKDFFVQTFAKVHKKAKSFENLIYKDFKKWLTLNKTQTSYRPSPPFSCIKRLW